VSAVDVVTRRRFDTLPARDDQGNRISTRERLRRARESTPEASSSSGTAAAPIEVLSSPASPDVQIVGWTRRVVQSASRPATRVRQSVWRYGYRVRLNPPVSPDTLYLTRAHPPDCILSEAHHMCSICRGVKEHPVS
jgi:hypothetical protein